MIENTIVVKHEWLSTMVDIVYFFLRHSTIEYDGLSRTANVKYNGPKGWNISLSTSFKPPIEGDLIQEVIE